ncbi:C40 family peptidase [Schlegelella sp. ID0723]|uniref:C40 family peptidase n=2 Tax=Piscinibacter koreensis TaxID=2742824 RepID=A0A7Y6TWN7_9BURK|nr:C40 family peptidase [Schlegelella koreensis]
MMQLLAERSLVQAPSDSAPASPGLFSRVRERASDMIVVAMNFIGVPYKRGGVSAEGGFDCSGFTRHVFDISLGLVLPRRAEEQANAPGLSSITRSELQPGDLVFFNTMRRAFSHVGIYIGGGRFIHAPRSGAEVRTESMSLAYWAERFNGARRAQVADVSRVNAAEPADGTPAAR